MDRGLWWATVQGVPKSQPQLKRMNTLPSSTFWESGLGLTSFEVILLPWGRQRDFRDWFFTGIQEGFES